MHCRGDARAAVAGGQLFVVGGVAGDNYDFIASVEAWDERNRRWVPKANMSYARGDFALAALQSGRLLASGGETKVGADSQFAQHAVEEYNPVEDAWVSTG